MTLEVQARIFTPMFTTKGEQGTGLGLASAYASLRRHGGTILVTSTPGQGSHFHIELPLFTIFFVRIAETVSELAGNPLETPFTSTFTTTSAAAATNSWVAIRPRIHGRRYRCQRASSSEGSGGPLWINLEAARPGNFLEERSLQDRIADGEALPDERQLVSEAFH